MTSRLICEIESHPEIVGAYWARLVREDDHGGVPQTDWALMLDREMLEEHAAEFGAAIHVNPNA